MIEAVGTAREALERLAALSFDCIVLDLNLPDASGFDVLDAMSTSQRHAFPPVIVYTGRELSAEDEDRLRRYSRSVIVKGARSPERLLDEVTLFLHRVEAALPSASQRLLRHIATGRAVVDAVRDAGNRWVFPEQLTDGLEPWGGVRAVWAAGSPQATHAVDTTDTFDAGVASLEAHRAYIDGLGWENWDPREFLEGFARQAGQRLGTTFAATFEVFPMGWGE